MIGVTKESTNLCFHLAFPLSLPPSAPPAERGEREEKLGGSDRERTSLPLLSLHIFHSAFTSADRTSLAKKGGGRDAEAGGGEKKEEEKKNR